MAKFQERYIEFKNVGKDIIDWFEDTVEETNCRVEKKEWKSKYNSYVTYDYEPFCSDGFEINVLVSSVDMSYLNFLQAKFFSTTPFFLHKTVSPSTDALPYSQYEQEGESSFVLSIFFLIFITVIILPHLFLRINIKNHNNTHYSQCKKCG